MESVSTKDLPQFCTRFRDHQSPVQPNPEAGGSGGEAALHRVRGNVASTTHRYSEPGEGRVTESGDAALLRFSQTARQLPVEARFFNAKISGQAPREQESPLHRWACHTRCTGKCGTDAGKAPHFGSEYRVNSNFLPRHTRGQNVALPWREPTRLTTRSQTSQRMIGYHQTLVSPGKLSTHHPSCP